MGRNTTHFYKQPMHFERGRGPWLFATDGRRYLDFYNNVAQIGHCHPHVVRAVSRQSAALNTNTRYLYSSVLDYAERLTGRLAPHLTTCLFVNSGSEANDVAWQMAKTVTGHSGAIIMEDAYHGVTDVMRLFSPGRPGKALPDFLQGLVVPDPYRGPYRNPARRPCRQICCRRRPGDRRTGDSRSQNCGFHGRFGVLLQRHSRRP